MAKNVLHLIDTNFLSGPGKTIYNSWRFVDPNRYRIHIAVFGDDSNDYIQFLKQHQVEVITIRERYFGLPYQFAYIFNVLTICWLIMRLKIDILHTHHHKADFFGLVAGLITGVKIISTHHGFIENTDKAAKANRIARWATKRMHAVIAVSEKMKNDLVNFGLPLNKLHMIHNAIVIEDYPSIPKCQHLLQELGIAGTHKVIGCIGRISKEKGQEILCEAYVQVKNELRDTVLVVVGFGPEYDRLYNTYASSNPSIVFTGFRKNVKEFISIFDIHVLPSYTEGLPNVVLETTLMGVPNIVTRVGGSPECVLDGETGLIVEPGNVQEMTAAMRTLLCERTIYEKFRQNGPEFIRTEYDFVQRMQKIMYLYDQVMN